MQVRGGVSGSRIEEAGSARLERTWQAGRMHAQAERRQRGVGWCGWRTFAARKKGASSALLKQRSVAQSVQRMAAGSSSLPVGTTGKGGCGGAGSLLPVPAQPRAPLVNPEGQRHVSAAQQTCRSLAEQTAAPYQT